MGINIYLECWVPYEERDEAFFQMVVRLLELACDEEAVFQRKSVPRDQVASLLRHAIDEQDFKDPGKKIMRSSGTGHGLASLFGCRYGSVKNGPAGGQALRAVSAHPSAAPFCAPFLTMSQDLCNLSGLKNRDGRRTSCGIEPGQLPRISKSFFFISSKLIRIRFQSGMRQSNGTMAFGMCHSWREWSITLT